MSRDIIIYIGLIYNYLANNGKCLSNEIKTNLTQVLIFENKRERSYQDEENFIIGIILSSKKSEDLSYHGSSWYEQIYEVLGEDGNRYYGCYGHGGFNGNSFFRTKEDHIKIIRSKIKKNEESILALYDENTKYQQQIDSILKNNQTNNLQKVKVKPKKTTK